MNYRECAELLRAHDRYLLITHKNPDGDTVCSAAALCSALRRMGKTAYLYPNPQIMPKLLRFAGAYFAPEDYQEELCVSVDVATEGLFPLGFAGDIFLCVDHHPTNTHFAPHELIREDRASCGEIVLELIRSLCGNLTQEEATLLYIAVTTDTGCFQYANTDYRTLAAASDLVRCGAENFPINRDFFRKVTPARIKLEGYIYSNLRYFRDGKVVIALATREMLEKSGATMDDCDDLAGLAGRVEGCDLNITIKEQEDGSSKVSVRSVPGVSSSAICAAFGGGGHDMAAGCTISCPPEKAVDLLMDVINEVYP
ncbi:MAG: bifunctional oligoribonuclease/PAP phosphatase NrnA [Oscillospiraceae bacterium]|nr:bifunctional oligoribonuclease/PAP phosphatase NrnA [Oscillospiraceae bacterium]